MLHRDVKPSNILIADDGEIRVADFGVAHAGSAVLDGATSLSDTVTAGLIGSPAYMSPERLCGEPADAGGDQFGFCASLYEGLHGQRPWRAETIDGLRTAIAGGLPPSPREVPRWLDAVVTRGLDPDPARRYPSMRALLADLAPPRRRWLWLALAAAIIASGITLVLAVRRGDDRDDACAAVASELDGVWDDAARATLAGTRPGDARSSTTRRGRRHAAAARATCPRSSDRSL